MNALSDAEVVERVVAGETALFEILMRRHNQRLYRTARAILRNDAEAEDAVQQAYIAAYRHLGQFAGEARFSTWLTRICIHEALALGRKKTRRAEVDLMSEQPTKPSPAPTPEQAASGRELAALLERAVDQLPEQYRLVFMLREVQQLSTEEAASSLEISEENVKVRLHRAKAMLREQMMAGLEAHVSEVFGFLGTRCDRIVTRVMEEIAALPPPRR